MKEIVRHFHDITGLDNYSSALGRDKNAAIQVENLEIGKNYSLEGRDGFTFNGIKSIQGQGLFNYIYTDPNTQLPVENMMFLKQGNLCLIDSTDSNFSTPTTLTIIPISPSTNWTYQILFDKTIGVYKLAIYSFNGLSFSPIRDPGLAQIFFYLGDGLNSQRTLADLATDINTQLYFAGGWTASTTGSASSVYCTAIPLRQLGNGEDQVPSSSMKYTVLTGSQTIFSRNYKEIPDNALTDIVKNNYQSQFETSEDPVPPTYVNKNNILFFTCGGYTPLLKYDGNSTYQAGLPDLQTFPLTASVTGGVGAFTGSYKYLMRLVRRDFRGNTIYSSYYSPAVVAPNAAPSVTLSFRNSPSWVSNGGELIGYPVATLNSVAATPTLSVSSFTETQLLSTEGRNLRIGDIISYYDSGSTQWNARRVADVNRPSGTITLSSNATVTSGGDTGKAYVDYRSFRIIETTISATVTSATLTLTSNKFVIGDSVWINGKTRWYKVTGVSGSQITIDEGVSVTNGDFISNTAIEVYRTKTGGISQFYYLTTRTWNSSTYADSTADASLGFLLTVPSKQFNPLKAFPKTITEHQSLLVATGDFYTPNTLYYEDIIGQESFPAATNYLNISSQEKGEITALLSEDFDNLAIFKRRSYFNLYGDFAKSVPQFSLNRGSDNGFGVPHQNCVMKTNGANIGLGESGIGVFSQGKVDLSKFKDISGVLIRGELKDQNYPLRYRIKPLWKRAICYNDQETSKVVFSVPYTLTHDYPASASLTYNGYTIDKSVRTSVYSKVYCWDYQYNFKSEWVMPEAVNQVLGAVNRPYFQPNVPTWGCVNYNGKMYFAGNAHTGAETFHLYKRNSKQNIFDKFLKLDSHNAIPYTLTTQWEDVGSPEIDKIFHEVKLYSLSEVLSSINILRNTVRFTVSIYYAKNFSLDYTLAGSLTFPVVEDSWFLSDAQTAYSSVREMILKLPMIKARAISLRFVVNTAFESPLISGYSLSYAVSHIPDRQK